MAPFGGTSPEMKRLGTFFRDLGLYTFVRWHNFFTNPPLCISEGELRGGLRTDRFCVESARTEHVVNILHSTLDTCPRDKKEKRERRIETSYFSLFSLLLSPFCLLPVDSVDFG